ncbi:MAG: virulence RhuM family protein [Salinivirgaceae bacterium]|nr:virulence RhuM family protein [Salinivirgaceae bacterium]
MNSTMTPYKPIDDNVVVYSTDDNTLRLDVHLANETVWLNVNQIASLFQRDRTVISRHIRNIYNEKELEENITCAKFAHVGVDNDQIYETVHYNLDVIISVGYRVKSLRGTQFRQWANRVLKDYLLKGYAVNQQLLHIEQRIDSRLLEHEKRLDTVEHKIDFFVRTNQIPVEQVFFNGQFFEARKLIEDLIRKAQQRVIVVDGYVDTVTFAMLDVRSKGVAADIYSGKDLADLRNAHNATAGVEPVATHIWSAPSHDRWLIVDNNLYHCGHSLKDMGRKLSAVTLMGIPPESVLNVIK